MEKHGAGDLEILKRGAGDVEILRHAVGAVMILKHDHVSVLVLLWGGHCENSKNLRGSSSMFQNLHIMMRHSKKSKEEKV